MKTAVCVRDSSVSYAYSFDECLAVLVVINMNKNIHLAEVIKTRSILSFRVVHSATAQISDVCDAFVSLTELSQIYINYAFYVTASITQYFHNVASKLKGN